MAEPIFIVDNVSYSYPGDIPALCDISLSVAPGERTAIIGANGTGKSTLLSLLDALIFARAGRVTFRGSEITERRMNDVAIQKEFRQAVGYVFQNPEIQLFCPTVREDILFGPLQLGVSPADAMKRFDRVVSLMRLSSLVDRSPHQLSLGEKKKVAIASVLAIEPEILLLDEPTAGLDPQTTRDIIAVLQEAHNAGKTVVFATHDLHIVEEIADRVHVFGIERRIIRSGSAEEIIGDRDFLQKNNLVHIHVHRHLHGHHTHEH